MLITLKSDDGSILTYRDNKRYLWLLSLVEPVVPTLTVIAFFWFDKNQLILLWPLVHAFVLIPILDLIFGEDTSNPPPEVLDHMEKDPYYRWLLHASIPLFWAGFLAAAWLVGTQELSLWAVLALAVGTGFASGTGITVGHELGHKQNRVDRFGAMLANAVSGYAHFCIEHNRGHHTWVATPEDPASAQYNESVYAFAVREIPGTLVRGLVHERERLAKKGLPFWHWRNEVLQGWAIKLAVDGSLIFAFGWIMVPFLIIHNFIGWYALTEANYLEHYGLKRGKRDNGRYLPCEPHHSWNTNHVVSNLMLFHLQRHSDHHANPLRPYQVLRNFDELPRLPSGYAGCFVLAAIPPIWFAVMNPKVLAWAEGDMNKINTG
ncbi:MAG: alkane 1-monooxygenase [Pseudomonadota bacterium]